MHKRTPKKEIPTMERRVPKNPKYANVKSTLDTGMTVDKVKFVTASEYAKRRDEIFYRISKGQLYALYNEYEADEYESINDTGKSDSHLRIVTHSESDQPVYDKPYLILDVRDPMDFNEYHLLQARNFPYTHMRRDQHHPEVYRFRNKPETLIIICCDDEKMSKDAAKLMVDRGVDNIFLLTGGLLEFSYEFPAFVEGNPPSPPKGFVSKTSSRLSKITEDKEMRGSESRGGTSLTSRTLDKHNQKYSSGSSSRMGAGSTRPGQMSARQSETNMSMGTGASVAESVISKAMSRKGRF